MKDWKDLIPMPDDEQYGKFMENIENKEEKKKATLDDLMELVCEYFGYTPEQINVTHRYDPFKTVRFYFCYLAYKESRFTYKEIGNYLKGKNHVTILAAVNRVEGWAKNDMNVMSNIISLKRDIRSKYKPVIRERYGRIKSK